MPQGEYARVASKAEILCMYDKAMMGYINYLLKYTSAEMNESVITVSTVQNYVGKIEVLRNILGFNENICENNEKEK